MKNYYEIIGVSVDADFVAIKKAYLQKIKEYHPDVYQGDKDFAMQKTAELNEAYNTLKDQDLKKRYDIENNFFSNTNKDKNKFNTESFESEDDTNIFKDFTNKFKSFFKGLKNDLSNFKKSHSKPKKEKEVRQIKVKNKNTKSEDKNANNENVKETEKIILTPAEIKERKDNIKRVILIWTLIIIVIILIILVIKIF